MICKLSDLVKVPVLRLWIEKFLTCFFKFVEWLQSATFHKVLHWSEETVLRWSNVWTIDWMRQNFDTVQFFKLVAGLSASMWLCIVLLKQSPFSTNKTWALFNQRIVDSIKLLAVKFSVDGATIRHNFKMQDSFEVPPNANHDLLSKLILLWNGWRSLTFGDPTLVSIVIDQVDPLLVWCHNSLPKTVFQRIVE